MCCVGVSCCRPSNQNHSSTIFLHQHHDWLVWSASFRAYIRCSSPSVKYRFWSSCNSNLMNLAHTLKFQAGSSYEAISFEKWMVLMSTFPTNTNWTETFPKSPIKKNARLFNTSSSCLKSLCCYFTSHVLKPVWWIDNPLLQRTWATRSDNQQPRFMISAW